MNALLLGLVVAQSAPLITESFDDARLLDRGWYDGSKIKIAGSGLKGSCIEYHWLPGTMTPESTQTLRRLFEPTETIQLRFAMKLSKGWGWTGRGFHPHLIQFMTTENGRYHGPAGSHLTLIIEPWEGKLRLGATDIQNKDKPHGLTQGPLKGGYNGKTYDSKDVLFKDDKWHVVEAQFKLNGLDMQRDQPKADGVIRGWVDGKLVIEQTNVILRSTDFPNMKVNQILLAPYFGQGLLPHEQTLWLDELSVRKPSD